MRFTVTIATLALMLTASAAPLAQPVGARPPTKSTTVKSSCTSKLPTKAASTAKVSSIIKSSTVKSSTAMVSTAVVPITVSSIVVTSAVASVVASSTSPATPVTAIVASSCDLATVAQPSNTLPAVSSGLTLVLIAQGTGTQNFTCADGTADSIPVSIGAVATLVNASCAVASGDLGAINEDAAAIGMHFFVDSTTPDFDIIGLGNTELKKTASVAAPVEADGTTDAAWLKLTAQTAGTTSSVKEIYRLVTKGGVAPATCDGQAPGVITVAYSAEYWFYSDLTEVAARRKRAANKH